jgi:hypothetical protein
MNSIPTTIKQRLAVAEAKQRTQDFRTALRRARRGPPEQFWETLWRLSPAEGGARYLDLERLRLEELALVVGPGFAEYGEGLDISALQALECGGPALLRELGLETYDAWCRRQPPQDEAGRA